MTLILNCLTPDYAIQVSDRRLVGADGRLFDDSSNKAICVNGTTVFSYTGLAFIDGRNRTDNWFLDTLADIWREHPNSSLTDTAEYVARRAAKAVKSAPCPEELKRLAFIGVGWGKLKGGRDLRPIYTIVSNSHTPNGKWTAEASSDFIVGHFTPAEGKLVMLVADGQPLNRTLKLALLRQMESCVRKGTGPGAISRLLVNAARAVAAGNPKVGKDLLVNSIPKSSVRIGGLKLYGTRPSRSVATFSYVPENTLKHIHYGPYVFAWGVCCRELVIHTNLSSRTP